MSKMLTFEIDNNGKSIEVHGNEEGLRFLIVTKQKLVSMDKQDHLHLMTPSWGGNELTDDMQGKDNELVDMVKVFLWK